MGAPLGFFLCCFSYVCEKPMLTCVWGFHEHSTITSEGIKLEYTHLPSTTSDTGGEKIPLVLIRLDLRVKRAQIRGDKLHFAVCLSVTTLVCVCPTTIRFSTPFKERKQETVLGNTSAATHQHNPVTNKQTY